MLVKPVEEALLVIDVPRTLYDVLERWYEVAIKACSPTSILRCCSVYVVVWVVSSVYWA